MDAPFGSWGTQTLIAGLTAEALIAPWVIKGAMDGPAFAAYVRKVLVPEIEPGTVVVLDNLATHRNVEAARTLREHGCCSSTVVRGKRPTGAFSDPSNPYSPELNPIEQAFSKLRLISEGSAHENSKTCSTPSVRSVISTTRKSAGTTSLLPDMSRVNVETL
jgi:transposase